MSIWRRIATSLGDEIRRDEFGPDGRLPTEQELSLRFGVNRHTVRRALAKLQQDGLLQTERGRGSFVRQRAVVYAVGKRTRFSETIHRQSKRPSGQIIDARLERAPPAIAKALRLSKGDEIVVIEVLGKVDGRPVSIAVHHFPAKRFPGLIDVYREEMTVTAALKRFGVDDYTRKSTLVSARPPTRREMTHLGVARSTPVVVTEAINVDGDGRPVEWGVAISAADRIKLLFSS